MVLIKDIYCTAEEVKSLEDKSFTIAKGSQYRMVRNPDGKEQERLIVPVKLSNGAIRDYIPNSKSRTRLVILFGPDTDTWIGKKGRFTTVMQNVFGQTKPVIYVE